MAGMRVIMVLAAALTVVSCADPGTMGNGGPAAMKPSNSKIEVEQPMARDENRRAGTIELPLTMLTPAVADLATRLNAPERDIEVLRAIPVTWNDGSAGCPQPDMSYTQALVPGYWVVLGHAGKRYSYHAGRNGMLKLCEKLSPDPTGAPPHGRYNDAV